jgi:exopolysaccharide biosynthesis polyprenyl glycosylphosphotransferase
METTGGGQVRSPSRWESPRPPREAAVSPGDQTRPFFLGDPLSVTSTSAPPRSTPRRRGVLHPLPRVGEETRRDALEQFAPEAIQESLHSQRTVDARDRAYRWSLAGADLLAAATAVLLMAPAGPAKLSLATILGIPLIGLVAKLQGLYDRDELLLNKTTLDEAPKLFHLATLFTMFTWLLSSELLVRPLGARQAVILWGSLFILVMLARRAARAAVQRRTPSERCLFIGDAGSYERLHAKFETASVAAELIGRMNLQRTGRFGARAAHERELRELIGWANVHRVIIEPQALPAEDMLDLVRAAKRVGVRVSLLPRILDVVGSSVVFDDLQGMTVLGVRRFGLTNSSRAVKRAFDLLGAGAILFFVAPIMGIIAALIRLDSPGPIFFRQTRIGRDGRPFRIYKFRTMVADAEARKGELQAHNEAGGGLFKIADDPRITRVGRFLRRTSLDELPQILNVVSGDMSLVGPRPLIVDEDVQIRGWDRGRLHLTPGMTGPWQIAGSARVPLHEMVKIDYVYVASWSLWEDVKILMRTIPYVLARRGM